MYSAGQDPVAQAMAAQEAALARHEQMLMHLRNEIAALTQAFARIPPLEADVQPGNLPSATVAPQASPTAAVAASPPLGVIPSPEGPLPMLESFSGEPDKCVSFLAQCSLIFREQRCIHNNDLKLK